MTRYTFASHRLQDIRALNEMFASSDAIAFSNTLPVVNIPELDAVYNTPLGYADWSGQLSRDFRSEHNDSIIRESTAAMRERGLPPFVVVGRILRDGEDPKCADTQSAVLASAMQAIDTFNASFSAVQIRHVGLLLDHFTVDDTVSANEIRGIIEKALQIKGH